MFQRHLTFNTSHHGPGGPYYFSFSTGPGPGPLVLLRPEEGRTRGESWQGWPESKLGNQRRGPNPAPPSYVPLINGGSQGKEGARNQTDRTSELLFYPKTDEKRPPHGDGGRGPG